MCNETEAVFTQYDNVGKIVWSIFDSLLPIYYSVIIVLIRKDLENIQISSLKGKYCTKCKNNVFKLMMIRMFHLLRGQPS